MSNTELSTLYHVCMHSVIYNIIALLGRDCDPIGKQFGLQL
jgi:hypothetical protein